MKNLSCLKSTFFAAGKIIPVIFFALLFSFQISAYPGRLDLSFRNALLDRADVRLVKVQPDGKILIAGTFTTRGAIVRQNFVRLNADGSVDATFNAADSFPPAAFDLQSDGKILVGRIGYFKRLNADGSVDPTFNVTGIIAPVAIYAIEVQPDGKILAYKNCGQNFGCGEGLTRFNADGSVDSVNGAPFLVRLLGNIFKIRYLPDENKILVGGSFIYTFNGTDYRSMIRLNSDGSVDPTFVVNWANINVSVVTEAKPLGNGKILICGQFKSIELMTRYHVAVLNSNGSLDRSFVPATNGLPPSVRDNLWVFGVEAQSDGKIIVGGTIVNQFDTQTYFARLDPNGSLDRTFNQGKATFGAVLVLKIYAGNRLLVGGRFFRFNDTRRRHGLARINLF